MGVEVSVYVSGGLSSLGYFSGTRHQVGPRHAVEPFVESLGFNRDGWVMVLHSRLFITVLRKGSGVGKAFFLSLGL